MTLFGYGKGATDAADAFRGGHIGKPSRVEGYCQCVADLAVEMEADGFDHVHLTDRLPCLGDGPEPIVAKAR